MPLHDLKKLKAGETEVSSQKSVVRKEMFDGMTSTRRIKRPVLRYHGGKFRLAPWVVSFFPEHRVYVEPFGGAASVLMFKQRSYAEIYNDLDVEVVNVFKVLRDCESAIELRRLLQLTPFSRVEFEAAYTQSQESIEQARRTVIKAFAGFGSSGVSRPCGMRTRASTHRSPTGFRDNSNRSGTTPAHDWKNYPQHIEVFVDRLQGVVIENRDAFAVMSTHDSIETLHYVDPPYSLATRNKGKDYRHELTDDDHRGLADNLRSLKGMVVLSGYPSALYDEELFSDWYRVERPHLADGAKKRTEVLWLNAAASERLQSRQLLFGSFDQ